MINKSDEWHFAQPVPSMRVAEYTLPFENIRRCRDSNAHLAMRERVFLYALVYSLAPRWSLEIGTYKGGSAYIISGALDDLDLGGKLITIDPNPEQIEIDWSGIAHNAISVKGFFPKDIRRAMPPDGSLFDFAFVDGDHRYDGVLDDLRTLPRILQDGAHVLLHDSYHADVERAIQKAVSQGWYRDAGRVGRVCNDLYPGELYGGLHLLVARSAQ